MMDNTNLPPIRAARANPQTCAIVSLYLAVLDDLSSEQRQSVYSHVDCCARCAAELQRVQHVTQLIAGFAGSSKTTPSARVDQAVMAAIAARTSTPLPEPEPALPLARQRPSPRHRNRRGLSLRWIGQLAAAVVLLLAGVMALYIHASQSFSIPANVSWSAYVLHYSETLRGAGGVPYHVETYHDLGTNRMNVETTEGNRLDVVAVSDSHSMLCLDMMHHVAQQGTCDWSTDDSLFDLAQLRSDIQAGRAVYLGKGRFQNQDVYRIRTRSGLILLLDMDYMPVNALYSNSNRPVYNTFDMLSPSQVPASMWDMSMPAGFRKGSMPPRP